MKRTTILLIMVMGISIGVFSQTFEKGNMAGSLGIGLPSNLVSGTSMKMPVVEGAFEYCPFEKMGIGSISLGVYVSAYSYGYDYTLWGLKYENNYNTFVTGVRGIYHFDFVTLTGNSAFDKLDIYAGIMTSMSFNTYKYTDYDWVGNNWVETKSTTTSSDFDIDTFIGARYNFAGPIGVYAEAGYAIRYLSVGISYTL